MPNKSSSLIGKICSVRFQFFDAKAGKLKFKLRPALIVGVEREILPCDLTILPISKVSHQHNVHPEFDHPLTHNDHKALGLRDDPSYVRTHKIATVHSKDLSFDNVNSSLLELYPEDYDVIKIKHERFSSTLFPSRVTVRKEIS